MCETSVHKGRILWGIWPTCNIFKIGDNHIFISHHARDPPSKDVVLLAWRKSLFSRKNLILQLSASQCQDHPRVNGLRLSFYCLGSIFYSINLCSYNALMEVGSSLNDLVAATMLNHSIHTLGTNGLKVLHPCLDRLMLDHNSMHRGRPVSLPLKSPHTAGLSPPCIHSNP